MNKCLTAVYHSPTGITSMTASTQPIANIAAGSPVISAPNTLATQVPTATGAQP